MRSFFHDPLDLLPETGGYICREVFCDLLQAFVRELLESNAYSAREDGLMPKDDRQNEQR
jgi:hypothetical protein